jgi:hypothetical protein
LVCSTDRILSKRQHSVISTKRGKGTSKDP